MPACEATLCRENAEENQAPRKCGALALSTCSILNFSAHAITGRHTNWSIITITATIVTMPSTIDRVSPLSAAAWRYEPRPGRRKSPNCSQAIRKNQRSGDRHHGIPNQADGGEWQFDLKKTLPPVKTVNRGGLAHLARNALQRGVKTKCHVPDLSCENEQNSAQFDAQLASRKKRSHGQHHSGKKAQYWNGLQNIEQRNHETLGARRYAAMYP